MKKLNFLLSGLVFFAIFSFAMCSSNDETTDETNDTSIVNLEKKMDNIEGKDSLNAKELGKEYTAKYICPMHCEGSGADKAGKCSVCEMELIENPSLQKK